MATVNSRNGEYRQYDRANRTLTQPSGNHGLSKVENDHERHPDVTTIVASKYRHRKGQQWQVV